MKFSPSAKLIALSLVASSSTVAEPIISSWYTEKAGSYAADYTSTNIVSGLGTNGLGVDGVPVFNSSDGMSYNNTGVWNRDAFFNEGVTFDSGNAHQAMEMFHYHANPAALRYAPGDSIDYDPTVVFTGLVANGGNNPFSESPDGKHARS